jgi:putative tricarboxylic transport membrane protein
MLAILETEQSYIAEYTQTKRLVPKVISEVWQKCKTNLLRSSIIGTIVGMLPGAGGPIASIIAYNEAVRWDKDPSRYGKGAADGIIASESANNAVIGGSLIPMMSLGIPGCPAAAVVMGGLLAHGIIPGSKLLVESGDIAYTFILSLITTNIIMLGIGYFMLRGTVYILKVPAHWVAPIILILSVIGSYAIRNSLLDVTAMVGAGIFSYLLAKVNVDPGPLSLGVVLGPIAEEALGVSLVIAKAKGSILEYLFFRPLCITLIIITILSALTPLFLSFRKKRMFNKTGCS